MLKKNNGITFTAYCAPTINGQAGEMVTAQLESAYEKLSQAGFDKTLALVEGEQEIEDINKEGLSTEQWIQNMSGMTEEIAMNVLNIAEKYQIQYYVKDWSFYNMARSFSGGTQEWFQEVIDNMFSAENPYIKHVAYGGNFGSDEPNVQEMERIVWQAAAYNQCIAKNGKGDGELFVNLLPDYASKIALSENEGYTYEQYVDYYFSNLAPKLGYVCWDYYPLKMDGSVRNTYLSNMELMAAKSREGKDPIECRMFIQAIGDNSGLRNIESVADFRYQIYSGMAFGIREFLYFTYDGGIFDATNQTYSEQYEYAKTVNKEVHGIEKAYSQYQWEGIMCKNADDSKPNATFSKLQNVVASKRMEIAECTQDTLVGIFKTQNTGCNGQDAFMIVNSANPKEQLSDAVTVRFTDAKTASVFRLGKQSIVTLNSDGTCTFSLNPGEGVFVIPRR